jgi:hypothetical protein
MSLYATVHGHNLLPEGVVREHVGAPGVNIDVLIQYYIQVRGRPLTYKSNMHPSLQATKSIYNSVRLGSVAGRYHGWPT